MKHKIHFFYLLAFLGALTDDIVGTIEQFKKGVKINIVQSTSTLSWGTAEIVIGRVSSIVRKNSTPHFLA